MDYQKVDPALAAALTEAPDPEARTLAVFVHLERSLGAEQIACLERLEVPAGQAGARVVTATVSVRAVAELTEQSWVQYVRLSRPMRPLDSTPPSGVG